MNDKVREAAKDAVWHFNRMAFSGSYGFLKCMESLQAALADSDQTVRAREQAGGLNHWAAVLEAHEPKGSAAGIVMLREAAKTLRALADAPPSTNPDTSVDGEPTEEMVDAAIASFPDGVLGGCCAHIPNALRAALAVQKKGEG